MTSPADEIREWLAEMQEVGDAVKRGFNSKCMHADEPCDEFLEALLVIRVLLDACALIDSSDSFYSTKQCDVASEAIDSAAQIVRGK